MRKTTKKDRNLVVDIISESFSNNPGINWIIRDGINRKIALKRLATYAFIKAFTETEFIFHQMKKEWLYVMMQRIIASHYKNSGINFTLRLLQ